MGNTLSESQDVIPNREDHRKELNISRKVTHKQFQRHLLREYSEACMWDLPWSVRDSVALYERFDASFNCISDVPPELPLRLPHLSYINLSYNQIEELPDSIGLMFHLKTLLLNHNHLQHLPSSLAQLEQLEKLDVSNNMLRELPAELGNMLALVKLNVGHNKLKTLPKSLGKSQSIEIILASHNRLEDPPQRLCNGSSASIIEYLRQARGMSNGIVTGNRLNVFPRVRGNQLQFSAPNTQSAMAEYIQAQTNTTNTPSRIKTPLLPPLDASTLDADVLRDRILGLIYGAALGDAIGIATENMTPDECTFHYDPNNFNFTHIIRDSHRTHWRPGDWTSHFDQMVGAPDLQEMLYIMSQALLMDSLIAWAGVMDELDFASRLCEWSKHGFPELGDTEGFLTSNSLIKVVTSHGYTSNPHGVASSLLSKLSPDDLDEFADNTALSRALIMGIPHFHDLAEVKSNAMRICKASHSHPIVLTSSVFLSALVALLLQGKNDLKDISAVEEMISTAEKCSASFIQDNIELLDDFKRHLKAKDFNSVNAGPIERYVVTPLSYAVAALRQPEEDWMKSVMSVVMRGGSSSSCNTSIVGALLGAKIGYTKLPKNLLDGLRPKQSQWVAVKVNLLLDMLGLP